MAPKVLRFLVAAALLCFLLAAPSACAITCPTVTRTVAPCTGYVTGRGTSPPPACCAGVRTLNSLARTTPDRRTACNCLKTFASRVRSLIDARVSGLPRACGVRLPYTISRNTNCNTV